MVLTLVFRAFKVPGGTDETRPEHYVADPEPAVAEPVAVAAAATAGQAADPRPGAGPGRHPVRARHLFPASY